MLNSRAAVMEKKEETTNCCFCFFSSTPSILIHRDFTCLDIFKVNPISNSYAGALLFDLDGTLKEEDFSKALSVDEVTDHDKSMQLIFPNKLRELLEKAIQNNLLIVVVTARMYLKSNHKTVVGALRKIHPKAFAQIYYTNRKDKYPVLNYVHNMLGLKSKNQLCMVDNDFGNVRKASLHGYSCIYFDIKENIKVAGIKLKDVNIVKFDERMKEIQNYISNFNKIPEVLEESKASSYIEMESLNRLGYRGYPA